MIYRTYAQKDSTIYEATARVKQNTGDDEVLEISKDIKGDDIVGNSRIIIKFDLTDISESIVNGSISGSAIKYYLNLSSIEQSKIESEYQLDVHPLAESWDEGIGQYYYEPHVEDGVSWLSRNNVDDWDVTNTSPELESSFYESVGGGLWYSKSTVNTTASQTFNKYTNDLRVDVTDYVNDWLHGTRENNGFIIKRPNSAESSSVEYGSSKFFSNETHTIYVPTIEVNWDTTEFNTGSLTEVDNTELILYPKNLKGHYKEQSKARIRIVGRERFRTRTFSTSSLYTTEKHLPETTYYQLRDVETNLVIISFDDIYTKVSCDTNGNYFDFWFNTLQPERFYQFEFKIDTDGNTEYYDGYVFKVIR